MINAGKAGEHYRWLDDLDYECVMEAYAEYWGQRNRRYGGYQWQSLINACRQQGVKEAGAHDAVGDARMTAALIRGMIFMSFHIIQILMMMNIISGNIRMKD